MISMTKNHGGQAIGGNEFGLNFSEDWGHLGDVLLGTRMIAGGCIGLGLWASEIATPVLKNLLPTVTNVESPRWKQYLGNPSPGWHLSIAVHPKIANSERTFMVKEAYSER
jgi:hypothetical protein